MYNCYNEAVKYLNDKYGTKDTIIGNTYGRNKTSKVAKTVNETKVLKDGKHVSKFSHDDQVVKLLMKQYYYGIAAKKELYYKLIELGVITESKILT